MAEFEEVLKVANEGRYNRDDFPPCTLLGWDDRQFWNAYLSKINTELESKRTTDLQEREVNK